MDVRMLTCMYVCMGTRVYVCRLEVGLSRQREQLGQRPWGCSEATGSELSTLPYNRYTNSTSGIAGKSPQEHSDEGNGTEPNSIEVRVE